MRLLRRRAPALTVVVITAAVLGACGIIGGDDESPPTTVPPTTTTTQPKVVAVAPEAGPINTTFTFVGVGFTPGDDVTFVVEFPNGTRYVGPEPHIVAANSTVTAQYRATQGNPVGEYAVRATSTRPETGEGRFTVTGAGGATPTSAPGATGTSGRTTDATTTTSAAARSTTTTRPTTTTTRP